MISFGSVSFAQKFECNELSEDNFKNMSMAFTVPSLFMYMVGYNDGKNKNRINYIDSDKKVLDKITELIKDGCSKNPDSNIYTLFINGMRDDYNNPNWGKDKKVDKTGPKLVVAYFVLKYRGVYS